VSRSQTGAARSFGIARHELFAVELAELVEHDGRFGAGIVELLRAVAQHVDERRRTRSHRTNPLDRLIPPRRAHFATRNGAR